MVWLLGFCLALSFSYNIALYHRRNFVQIGLKNRSIELARSGDNAMEIVKIALEIEKQVNTWDKMQKGE